MNKWILLTVLTILSSTLQAADSIKIGMTAALTGSASALGLNMKVGIESYFAFVNEQGGVNGRLIEFIVKDDGYEPERAASNMRSLIEKDEVIAVIGNVGTPTAIVTVPIAQQKQTLLFGAYSGGGVLRPEPANRYIINYRASYIEETAEMIKGLLSIGIKPEEIAFFTQGDGFGDAAYKGAIEALHQAGFQHTEQLVHGRYARNTLNVENAIANILDAPVEPKAIIMAAGYKSAAKFITILKQEIPEMLFLNLSFVGGDALQMMLGDDADGVIITQVVPSLGSELPVVKEYLTALTQYAPERDPDSVSLEGFIVAKLFHQGLLNIEQDITKENIIDGIEALNDIDIGLGEKVNYSSTEHQAIYKLWLTCIQNGVIKPFEWALLLESRRMQQK